MDTYIQNGVAQHVQEDLTTNIERELVEIWESVFERPVNGQDDFFQLGGDSIKAMALVSKINRRFGVLLQIEEIFEDGSLAYQLDRIQNDAIPNAPNIPQAPVQEFYPLSNTQKSLFAISYLNPDSVRTNIPIICKVYGGLSLDLLRNSVREIIRRHEILRTAFLINGSSVVQKVLDKVEFDINPVEREGRSMREVVESCLKPHDLAEPPLFKIHAVIDKGVVKYLLFDSHHIISDLISLNVFINEFLLLYRGEPLKPLKNQYKDFAYWEQQRMPEVNATQKDFWLETFNTVPPKINLPVDTDITEKHQFNAATYKFELEQDEITKVQELCKSERISQFTLLMSFFYVFLHKVSQQDDLVVSLTSHGRNYPELHELIGVFVNTLPVRMKVDPELPFSIFVHQFKQEVPKYFANQDFHYDSVLQHLRAKNLIKNEGLYNVMFEHHIIDWQDPKLNMVDRPLLNAKCDLAFQVGSKAEGGEFGEELLIFVEYNQDLFKRETIELISKYFSRLMEELTENIDAKISDLGNFQEFKAGPYQLQEKFHKIDKRHDLQ